MRVYDGIMLVSGWWMVVGGWEFSSGGVCGCLRVFAGVGGVPDERRVPVWEG